MESIYIIDFRLRALDPKASVCLFLLVGLEHLRKIKHGFFFSPRGVKAKTGKTLKTPV